MGTIEKTDQNSVVHTFAWAAEAAGRVWAITPEAFDKMCDLPNNFVIEVAEEEAARKRGRPPRISGDVAVVGLKGVLMPGMSLLEMLFGIESGLSSFQNGLARAIEDPDVGAIVMDVDSPGGLVDQMPETAAMIRQAKEIKPIVAVSNTLAASGAYWLASQANELVVTPSGETGSIGVYAQHKDMSVALEKLGVKTTLVSAGKYKTEGNPFQPLDNEARAALQESVLDYYEMFTKDVATGRGVSTSSVKNGFGEGRVLTAKRSVDAGLADRVDTLDNVVAGLKRRKKSTEVATASAAEVEYTSEERDRLVTTLANLGVASSR